MQMSDQVKIAIINAAREITVAKINAKGSRFDGYMGPMNWFRQSLKEVTEGLEEVIEKSKR